MKKKDESIIPKGSYCYAFHGWKIGEEPKTTICPYFTHKGVSKETGRHLAYCKFLEQGEENPDTMLLFDQVKECGINTDDE
jgi:hypothetical protein